MRELLLLLLLLVAAMTACVCEGAARGNPPRLLVQPPLSNPKDVPYEVRAMRSTKVPSADERKALCRVERVTASGGSSPREALEHACKYAQPSNVNEGEGGKVTADLDEPGDIEFKRVSQHFFSDIDPRADYAVLGTPGGDTGEIINAFIAAEKEWGSPIKRNRLNVLTQKLWAVLAARGRPYFYMSTDEASMAKIAAAANTTDPTRPETDEKRNAVVHHAALPENIGCPHLRALVENEKTRRIAKTIVQVFWSVMLDGLNPMHSKLLLVVLKGELAPAPTAVRVWSPDTCPGIAPVLVPDNGGTKSAIVHDAHVKFFRQDLARFLTQENASLDIERVYQAMNALAAEQAATSHALYFSGEMTDVVFKSYTSSWPF